MTKDERRIIAEKHNEYMEDAFVNETNECISNSKIYENVLYYPVIESNGEDYSTVNISVIDSTSEKAVQMVCEDINNPNHWCLLNFASFTRPGGGFIKGSIAQEEAICHASNLYNVLKSFTTEYNANYTKERLNNGLYKNWAIYSPNVTFVYNEQTTSESIKIVDVLTCAAPNGKAYHENTGGYITDARYEDAMKSRVQFILDTAHIANAKNLILGAFGCGVFGNDPKFVAQCFKELLPKYNFSNVIFAIPRGRDSNLTAFQKIFK